MAYFAKLNLENKVVQVISVNNNELLENGIESEEKGIQFCKSIYGEDTIWKKTSYNTKAGKYFNTDSITGIQTLGDQSKAFRKNYAGLNFTYDENRDAFIPYKPYNSWVLNENTCCWEAPVEYPTTYTLSLKDPVTNELVQDPYIWNETIKNWEISSI